MATYFDDVQGDVASIFLSYFQRAPEFEAMQWYVGILEGFQADEETAPSAFKLLAAQIYADGVAHQEVPAGPTVTDGWYVSYLYSNILGRAPDAEGLAYWTAQLQNGSIERAELVGSFLAAALDAGGRDAAYVQNRTFVATEFAQWENSNPQVLPTLKYNAAEVLFGVNEDPATVVAAQERLETSTGSIGGTWNLTSGIDDFLGTTANDTFNAVFDTNVGAGDDGSTLTAFDTINGNLGFDTLNIYVRDEDTNGAFPTTAVVTNIEVVNVYNGEAVATGEDVGAGYNYLNDVSNYQGIEQFWQIDSANYVLNAGNDVLVGFRDIEELGTGVLLAAGVTEANIALDNVGPTGVNELSPGAFLIVSGKALTTINIEGELNDEDTFLFLQAQVGKDVRSLTLSTEADTYLQVARGEDSKAASTINTLDLSGSTGDILFYIGEDQADELVNANSALNITFGSGDDLVVFDVQEGRGLTLRDNIDGGEGYNTIVLTNDGKLQTQNYDAIARLENFQQIVFAGEDVQVDAAELEGYELAFGGDGDVVVSNLASGAEITIGSFGAAFGDEDADEPDTVTLKAAGKDVSIEVTDNVTFQLVVDATNTASIGDKNGVLTLSGEGAVLFSNAAAGKFAVIDASELDGFKLDADDILDLEEDLPFLDLDLDAGVSVGLVLAAVEVDEDGDIVGIGAGLSGSVQETVSLNTATLDLIVLGVSLEDNDTANSSTYGRMDVIEGFNSTESNTTPLDYLLGEGTIGKHTLSANDTSLQLAFQSVAQASALDGAPDVLFFVFEGDTYLFSDTVGGNSGQYDNSDFALKIIGAHDLTAQWIDISAPV